MMHLKKLSIALTALCVLALGTTAAWSQDLKFSLADDGAEAVATTDEGAEAVEGVIVAGPGCSYGYNSFRTGCFQQQRGVRPLLSRLPLRNNGCRVTQCQDPCSYGPAYSCQSNCGIYNCRGGCGSGFACSGEFVLPEGETTCPSTCPGFNAGCGLARNNGCAMGRNAGCNTPRLPLFRGLLARNNCQPRFNNCDMGYGAPYDYASCQGQYACDYQPRLGCNRGWNACGGTEMYPRYCNRGGLFAGLRCGQSNCGCNYGNACNQGFYYGEPVPVATPGEAPAAE